MIEGLQRFRDHFREFTEQYVLIGGAACDLYMEDAGLPFRVTKDLDIVLCVEVLDAAFVEAFWEFVREGGYEIREKSTGEKQFYRFTDPATADYPEMLELFSRTPDILTPAEGSHLTPIPVGEEVASLSAILLDDDYYNWIRAGKEEVEGVPVVTPKHVIPLKGRAWLDLSARKQAGERGNSRNIKKHKNDIFRLFQILDPEPITDVPQAIKEDLEKFITAMDSEQVDLKALGFGPRANKEDILSNLRSIYGLD